MNRLRQATSSFCAWGFLLACKVYDPGLVAECVGAVPPSRPAPAAATEGAARVFALKDLLLNQGENRWTAIGYNLDGYCTDMAHPRSDCRPTQRVQDDGVNGVDNELGHTVFELLLRAQPGLEQSSQMGLGEGKFNPAIRLSQWNETPNDERVAVEFFSVVAVVRANPTMPDVAPDVTLQGGVPYVAGMPAQPDWMGRNWAFAPDNSELFNIDASRDPNRSTVVFRDMNAYVRDGVLVANIPQGVEITFLGTIYGVNVRLLGGLVTATIAADGARLTDIVVAGRWAVQDLLQNAENVGVCRGSSLYSSLDAVLAGAADVTADTRNSGMGAACDAISVGLLFRTGVAVQLAPRFLIPPPFPRPCLAGDAGLDATVDGAFDAGLGDTNIRDRGLEQDSFVDAAATDASMGATRG